MLRLACTCSVHSIQFNSIQFAARSRTGANTTRRHTGRRTCRVRTDDTRSASSPGTLHEASHPLRRLCDEYNVARVRDGEGPCPTSHTHPARERYNAMHNMHSVIMSGPRMCALRASRCVRARGCSARHCLAEIDLASSAAQRAGAASDRVRVRASLVADAESATSAESERQDRGQQLLRSRCEAHRSGMPSYVCMYQVLRACDVQRSGSDALPPTPHVTRQVLFARSAPPRTLSTPAQTGASSRQGRSP